jgi:hypothetical protein
MRATAATLALSLFALPAAAQDAASSPAAPATTEATAPTPPTAPTPATPAPTEGTLSVTSSIPGKVFIDGTDTGLVTPIVDLAVAVGLHTVKVVTDDGRTQSAEFTIEAGGSLSLHLAVAEPAAAPTAPTAPTEEKPAEVAAPTEAKKPADWTWMTVTGWSGLGLGTIGVLSGAVVMYTPTDPQRGPLGFGLFGAGAGFALGGAVLLYLDNELSESTAAATEPAKS